MEKKCFKCSIKKPLSEYYKHPQMGDGHLNKCKQCTKNDSINQYNINLKDESWKLKEKLRGRNKYHKYKYKSKSNKSESMSNYRNKYPEKYKAKCLSGKIKVPKGYEKHHWSYNEEHGKDVIVIPVLDHAKIHRYMIYNQSSKMYISLEGNLLDTREKHEQYISAILKIPF